LGLRYESSNIRISPPKRTPHPNSQETPPIHQTSPFISSLGPVFHLLFAAAADSQAISMVRDWNGIVASRNGVDLEHFRDREDRPASGPYRILFAGRLETVKRPCCWPKSRAGCGSTADAMISASWWRATARKPRDCASECEPSAWMVSSSSAGR